MPVSMLLSSTLSVAGEPLDEGELAGKFGRPVLNPRRGPLLLACVNRATVAARGLEPFPEQQSVPKKKTSAAFLPSTCFPPLL
jgi:hypothetical protein